MEDQNGSQHFNTGDLVEETIRFTIKFVVSRCVLCKLRRDLGFSGPSIIWVGAKLMQITMQRTCPAWPVNTKLTWNWEWPWTVMNYSNRNRDGEWNFCFILASDKNKKDQENLRSKLVDYCPKQDDHKQRTLKHRNEQNGSKSTNHKSKTKTFWTRSSKQSSPKRSAKMISLV